MCRQETRPKALAFFPKIGLSDNGHGVLRILPPWRLVLLEGGVASEASYPAWSVAETSRPKALVFLSLWWLLSGIKGEPSDLPIGF